MRFMSIVKAAPASEVRRLFELEDFEPYAVIDRFREMARGHTQ